MTNKLSIILLESDTRVAGEIVAILKTLGDAVGTVRVAVNFQELTRVIPSGEPHIVLLEVKEIEQGVKDTDFLISQFPQTTVIVTATEKTPGWILRLIRAGASEYLTKPIDAAELTDAIKNVTRLRMQNSSEPVRETGTVISVYNPSGGVGTSTIAVNLAASLAASGNNVVLVDLNLFNGDVTAFLDLAPRYTLSSVTNRQGHIDSSFLRSVIVTHPSGLQILSAPIDIGEADEVTPGQIREVIAVLKKIFTYIIIDTGGELFGCNLAAFGNSELILFVTVLNFPALRNTKRYLAAMNNEGLGPAKVKLIINRQTPKDDIKVADAEKVLSSKAYLTVPNAYFDVKTSINKGEPLVTSNPRSPVAKAMENLARQVVHETAGGSR